MTDIEKAKPLLDLIAGPESGGDYNVIFGHHEKGLSTPITDMQLRPLAQTQLSWGRKWGSSAAGRYQIIRETMLACQKALGLPGTARFTPEVQDRMALYLLEQRGLDEFLAGKLTIIQFGLNLAKCWASFPVLAPCWGPHGQIKRGDSFYHGDGVNKTLIAPEAVEAALTKLRI